MKVEAREMLVMSAFDLYKAIETYDRCAAAYVKHQKSQGLFLEKRNELYRSLALALSLVDELAGKYDISMYDLMDDAKVMRETR